MFLCNNAACPVKFTSHVFLRDELEASISEFKQSENYVNIQTSKFEDVVSKIEHFIRTVKLSKTNQVCVHLPIYVGRSNLIVSSYQNCLKFPKMSVPLTHLLLLAYFNPMFHFYRS